MMSSKKSSGLSSFMLQSQQSPFTQSLLLRANSHNPASSTNKSLCKSIDRNNRGFSAVAAQAVNNSLAVNGAGLAKAKE
jgi:hypothetical protein